MNKEIKQLEVPIQSYISTNREKIDESLVSLRLMKEVDLFLDSKSLSNRELAKNIGCSESFISQLMSGVKKVNTAFINKFEKQFKVQIKFTIVDNNNLVEAFTYRSGSYVNYGVADVNIIKVPLDKNSFNIDESICFTEYVEI